MASNATVHAPSPAPSRNAISGGWFYAILILLVLAAILRSAIATRFDDFSMDEAYHIVAGVSYVKRGDFRINPEHPPLVKLWVGAVTSAFGFHLSPFRELHDKFDERTFVNDDTYYRNDPEAMQRHARAAMFVLNGTLLVFFGFALRRVFGSFVAIGTILFLALDPTVAGHFPQVMTDLPVSLLAATAVVLAARAFRDWRATDFALTSLALGLALATKHSAPAFCVALAAAGLVCAFVVPFAEIRDTRARRLLLIAAMLLGAVAILWGFYRFRFTESAAPQEVFNRALADKIEDIHSPRYRFALSRLAQARLLPRAYLWGLADVTRAGLEGRIASRLVFGRMYWGNGPVYFFPGVIAVKLPIGLEVLMLAGIFLFFARRLRAEWRIPGFVLSFAIVAFFFVLARGSTYGGMRHALPAAMLLSVFAGFAVHYAATSPRKFPRLVVALAIVLAAISALPILRPYEYYNELVGGASNAYLYFNDEGMDMQMRMKDLARYYRQNIEPAHEIPVFQYSSFEQEQNYMKLDWIGRDRKRDEHFYESRNFTGTVFVEARHLGPRLFYDYAGFRAAKPTARFGALLVYRGTFDVSPMLAEDRYWAGLNELFVNRDSAAAEKLFLRSVDLDPSGFWAFIELGNLYLAHGDREKAIRAYRGARDHSPANTIFRSEIEEQLQLVQTQDISQIRPLRDPNLE
ncbi:MAG TPA: hypothetical protein VKT53_03545 [Candidatus Acidoferrum sp.]|nr:hypothetical protein [Candidatus Acidoferrum sp.]